MGARKNGTSEAKKDAGKAKKRRPGARDVNLAFPAHKQQTETIVQIGNQLSPEPPLADSHLWLSQDANSQRENAALIARAIAQRWATDQPLGDVGKARRSALTPKELALRATVEALQSDREDVRLQAAKVLVAMERQNQNDQLPRPEHTSQHLHLHDDQTIDPAVIIARKLERSRAAVQERLRRAAAKRIR